MPQEKEVLQVWQPHNFQGVITEIDTNAENNVRGSQGDSEKDVGSI